MASDTKQVAGQTDTAAPYAFLHIDEKLSYLIHSQPQPIRPNIPTLMKLLILSDLHLELRRDSPPEVNATAVGADAVILAGDIDTGTRGVAWASKTFAGVPVFYVAGNHESYGRNLDDMDKKLAISCEATPNVHFLNCGEYIIGSTRFLGAPLWTDFNLFGQDRRAEAMEKAAALMTDYRRIRLAQHAYRKLRPEDTRKLHETHRAWLEKKLVEPFAGRTVVITHMAPSFRSVPIKYREDLLSAAFASDLEPLVRQADLWIHGHMHDSFDYELGRCRVVCNPAGYMSASGDVENAAFDPNFSIWLD